MERWSNRFLLPFLLLALAVALYSEFNSVETINLDPDYSASRMNNPRQTKSSQRNESSAVSRLAVGERYASLEDLMVDQNADGYLKTGSFGGFWPAKVVEIKSDNDGIVFHKQDSSKHSYTGFDGYRMKMVRLNDVGARETIIVLRSIVKRH